MPVAPEPRVVLRRAEALRHARRALEVLGGVDQVVAHLVRGKGQEEVNLSPNPPDDPLEQRHETIAAEDGKGDCRIPLRDLVANVRGDLLQSDDIALRPRHEGLRDPYHVAVPEGEGRVARCRGLDEVFRGHLHQVVAPADHGHTNSMHLNANLTKHCLSHNDPLPP